MSDWLQQMENERESWETAWWLSLDADPRFLEWLKAESYRLVAEVHGQLTLNGFNETE